MIIYFADRRFNVLDQASTLLPDGLIVSDDLKTEDVETGVATFECRMPFDSKTRNRVKACTEVGNYILRNHNEENEYFTIIDSEWDEKNREVYIYAEDAGLDLLNEIVGGYAASEAKPISHYIEQFAYDSGFEIGINEIENLTRKLSWDGEETITARLASVATQFDNAEISYSFDVKGLRVVKKYINIHKKRGQDAGVQLRMNREIDNIVISKSIANVATALRVTGGMPEESDTPITLDGYKYDDGDFFLEGTYLKSREAHAIWSRYLAENGTYTGHICKRFEYDTTSQSELCNRAIAELKKMREVEINYKIDITNLPENVRIGDRVNVVDDENELYVSARILRLETSVANETQTATIGEYLIKDSGIAQKVIDMAAKFAELSLSDQRAKQIADEAKNLATEAKNTADGVAGDVASAKTAADEAKASAETAAQSASAAEQAATDAQTSANEAVENANATKTQVENLKKQYEGLEGSFIHIRYSEYEDGHAMTEEPTDYSLYIGICSTMDDKAPTDHTEYTWTRIGTDNTKLEEIKEVIVEQNTTILNDCESIILQALESYVETNNYEEFKETVSSQLQLLADEMTLTFTTTTEQITEVNGDFQSKWNRLLKHIEFSGDTAISISSDGTAITLELDNEKGIVFKKNGVQFGWWDGVDFHTGNIIVDLNERAQFGNFAFVPRSDGSLSFLKVGG